MGVGARYNSANMEALQQLPWQAQDKQVLTKQMSSVKGIPEVPGGYLTLRNVGFAISSVYNTNASSRDTLLNYVDQINQELTLKRKEFGVK